MGCTGMEYIDWMGAWKEWGVYGKDGMRYRKKGYVKDGVYGKDGMRYEKYGVGYEKDGWV